MSEYNYLGLVNDVNERLNEVPLTESNFISASGFYNSVKSGVNNAIRYINSKEYQWSFNHKTGQLVLDTDGKIKYDFPSNAKVIDFDTFRITLEQGDFDPDDFDTDDFLTQNTTSNKVRWLRPIAYDTFVSNYLHYQYNTSTSGVPRLVFQTQDRKIGIIPSADEKYTVEYEYWVRPTALTNYQDVPTIPESERWVINEGTMYYAYMFRGDKESALISWESFKLGVSQMRNVFINKMSTVTTKRNIP